MHGVGLTRFLVFTVMPDTSNSEKRLSFTLFLCPKHKKGDADSRKVEAKFNFKKLYV